MPPPIGPIASQYNVDAAKESETLQAVWWMMCIRYGEPLQQRNSEKTEEIGKESGLSFPTSLPTVSSSLQVSSLTSRPLSFDSQ